MTEIKKSKVLSFCKDFIDQEIQELHAEIKKVKEDAASETKSSMGDKYETGREMMMQEEIKLTKRLENLLKQKVSIETIDSKPHDVIKNGSFIKTDQSTFLIATALGVFSIEEKQIFVISQSAPLAKEMMGKKGGDSISFNGRKQEIISVC